MIRTTKSLLLSLTKVPAQTFYMYPEYEPPFITEDGNFETNEKVLSRNRAGIK